MICILQIKAAPESHPTDDVDAVVGVPSMLEFKTFENELEARGFTRQEEEAGITKTWFYQGVKLNLTPMHTDVVGFHNQWFEEGVFHSRPHILEGDIQIRIFTPVYYFSLQNRSLYQPWKSGFSHERRFSGHCFSTSQPT